MSKNNNNKKRGKNQPAQQLKALKAEILNDIRMAAGQAPKGKGRGRRSRQAKGGNFGAPNGEPQAAAVAYSSQMKTRDARIQYSGNGQCCRVQHMERIGTILGSAGFAVNSFVINPGMAATFPWLAAIAQRFESYRFRRLRFLFRRRRPHRPPATSFCLWTMTLLMPRPSRRFRLRTMPSRPLALPGRTFRMILRR